MGPKYRASQWLKKSADGKSFELTSVFEEYYHVCRIRVFLKINVMITTSIMD